MWKYDSDYANIKQTVKCEMICMKRKADEIRYSKYARNYIKKLEENKKEVLRKAINEHLVFLPPSGDVKELQGFNDGRMRLRIGSIRIIFRYDEERNLIILNILDIGPRGDICK